MKCCSVMKPRLTSTRRCRSPTPPGAAKHDLLPGLSRGPIKCYGKPQGRKEVTDRIIVAAPAALECMEPANGRIFQRAWCPGVEAWLVENRVITLSQSQQGVAHFSEENVSLSLR